MYEFWVRQALRAYPREFRGRFGPQIEVDLGEQAAGRVGALAELISAGVRYRLRTPGPYLFVGSVTVAAAVFSAASAMAPRIPVAQTRLAIYMTMFSAVFFVLIATLFLSVVWLQWSKPKA